MRLKNRLLVPVAMALLLLGNLTTAQAQRGRRGKLDIKTNPSARVYMKGQSKGRTPIKLNAPPGRHTIVFKAPGYNDLRVSVNVRPGRVTRVFHKLVPKAPPSGKISVRSQPPARVFLGGKPIGRTPILNRSFPRGRHTVKLVTKDGREWATTIHIRKGFPAKINHRFRPRYARLKINTNPPARVLLNGRSIGTTPLAQEKIKPGRHKIIFRARGYFSETVTFVARPGELKTITRKLRPRVPPTGKISVRSQPPARVFLGGKSVGRTPVLNHTFPRGRHPLKLVTKRGREWTTTVEIKHGAPVMINHRFPPLHAKLRVNSNPTAMVLLNGRSIGKTPVSMGKLKPGKHTIRLNARGHHPETVTFVARPGELKNIVRKLRPKRRKRRMGWIHATSSPRARVFLNGKFMGVTPMPKIEAPPGVHKIRFEPRKGRKGTIERRTVRVEPGRGTRVNVTLKRRRRRR